MIRTPNGINKSVATLFALVPAVAILFVSCSSDTPSIANQQRQVSLTITPSDGAVNVSTTTAFLITFDRALDHRSAESAVMLHRGWGVGGMTRGGSFTWNPDGMRMTFQPEMPLDSNATYTIHINGMMDGMDGVEYMMMLDTTRMGGRMMSGRQMGGMGDDEIRIVCSTGPIIEQQLALDLTGDMIYVADGKSGDIAVINPTTNALIAIQPIMNIKFLHHLSLSPDRTKLIVSDPGEDMSSGGTNAGGGHGGHGGTILGESKILVLDSRTLQEVGRIVIEGVTHNARVLPDGHTLLFNNAEHNTLHRYSFPELVSQTSYPVGEEPLEVTVTPDGEYALTANSGDGSVSRVHLTMEMPSDSLSVGQTPVGAWITPDGRSAWVTNEGSKSVTVLSISPFAVDTTLVLGFTPGQVMVNPIRSEAYIADEDGGRVVIYDSETYARLGEIATGMGAHGIAFIPDGSKAYVTNEHAMSVSVIETSSRSVVATVQVGMMPNGIVFRPAL